MHEAQPPEPPPLPTPRETKAKSWQFSMRTMMLAMTGFAILFGLMSLVSARIVFLLIGIFWFAASGVLATGVVFARGDMRAFCIGAGVMFLSTWTRTGGDFLGMVVDLFEVIGSTLGVPQLSIFIEAALKYVVLLALAIANGYLCVRARRFFEAHSSE